MPLSVAALAAMIDHSLLHPTLTDEQLAAGCDLAKRYAVASVCIKPYAVTLARENLAGSRVAVGTVVGFPHGNSTTAVKTTETAAACRDGATEIDMVVNIGKVLGGDWEYVDAELRAVNAAALSGGAILKVIFETDFLPDESIVRLCGYCTEAAVAFVKTSTGYGFVQQPDGHYASAGATDDRLRLMRRSAGPAVQVKAAGGVRTLERLLAVRALGVSRVGATATAAILDRAAAILASGGRLEDLR